jgi:uncharacterized protein (TIGR03083 family)
MGVVDIADTRMAIERAAERVVRLAATAPHAGVVVPDSDWTVRDVLVHLALGTETYVTYVNGATEPFVDVSDIAGGSLARSSAARLAADPEQDLLALTMRVSAAMASLLEATAGRHSNDPVMWNGVPLELGSMMAMGLGEYLRHGVDVARALSQPWPIEPDDARLVLAAAMPLLPLLVNPASTAGVRVAYDLRIRGGERFTVQIDDGALAVERADRDVDCHVSGEPVALLLVAYGRRSQWVPVLTGKLVAWGRKPWAGLRMMRYVVTP